MFWWMVRYVNDQFPTTSPTQTAKNVVSKYQMNVGISLTTASTFSRVPCSASEALVFVAALWHIKFQMCKSHGQPWLLVEISTSHSDSILWMWCCGLSTRNSWTELRFCFFCFFKGLWHLIRWLKKRTALEMHAVYITILERGFWKITKDRVTFN